MVFTCGDSSLAKAFGALKENLINAAGHVLALVFNARHGKLIIVINGIGGDFLDFVNRALCNLISSKKKLNRGLDLSLSLPTLFTPFWEGKIRALCLPGVEIYA
jgi:hypothetical protein